MSTTIQNVKEFVCINFLKNRNMRIRQREQFKPGKRLLNDDHRQFLTLPRGKSPSAAKRPFGDESAVRVYWV
jgi:hypothetical protein